MRAEFGMRMELELFNLFEEKRLEYDSERVAMLQNIVWKSIKEYSSEDWDEVSGKSEGVGREEGSGKFVSKSYLGEGKVKDREGEGMTKEEESKRELLDILSKKSKDKYRLVYKNDGTYEIERVMVVGTEGDKFKYKKKLENGNWSSVREINKRTMELTICDICGVPYTASGVANTIDKVFIRRKEGLSSEDVLPYVMEGKDRKRSVYLSKYNPLDFSYDFSSKKFHFNNIKFGKFRENEVEKYSMYLYVLIERFMDLGRSRKDKKYEALRDYSGNVEIFKNMERFKDLLRSKIG